MAMAAGLEWNVCMKRADILGRLSPPMAELRALQRQSAASSHLVSSPPSSTFFFFSSQHRPLSFFLFIPACFVTAQEALWRAGGENTWLCNVI